MPEPDDVHPNLSDDALDDHALAWVDAFRDHGRAVCFEAVRAQVVSGRERVLPTFLSGELLDAIGSELQAYRDRILELRYQPAAMAGPDPG